MDVCVFLYLPSSFPWWWLRCIAGKDGGNLVNLFLRVTHVMTHSYSCRLPALVLIYFQLEYFEPHSQSRNYTVQHQNATMSKELFKMQKCQKNYPYNAQIQNEEHDKNSAQHIHVVVQDVSNLLSNRMGMHKKSTCTISFFSEGSEVCNWLGQDDSSPLYKLPFI